MIANKLQAYGGELLSRTGVAVYDRYPRIGRLIVGGPEIERVIYTVAKTPASAIPKSSRVKILGDPEGTRLPFPGLYEQAGAIHPNLDVLASTRDTLLHRSGVSQETLKDAVGFVFGKCVMAAALPEGLNRLPSELGMRVGREPAEVFSCLYDTDTRVVYAPENALTDDTAVEIQHRPISSLVEEGIRIF